MRRLLVVLLGLTLVLAAPVLAQGIGPEQKTAIEKLIRDYILNNPEVIIEALERLENRAAGQPSPAQLAAVKDAMFRDPETPVANPKGTIPVVEFFDYRCGYCKKMVPDMRRLLQSETGVRVIFKDLPILGPDSVIAARAALASRAQGKYETYHFALMDTKGAFTEPRVLAIAKEVGLDVERLKRDMADPRIDAQIDANLALAKQLNIRGTPTLIIGDAFVPGSVDFDTLKKLVDKARTSCSVC